MRLRVAPLTFPGSTGPIPLFHFPVWSPSYVHTDRTCTHAHTHVRHVRPPITRPAAPSSSTATAALWLYVFVPYSDSGLVHAWVGQILLNCDVFKRLFVRPTERRSEGHEVAR